MIDDSANFCYHCGSATKIVDRSITQESTKQEFTKQEFTKQESTKIPTDVLSPMEYNLLHSQNSHLLAVGTLGTSSKSEVLGQEYNGVIEDYKKVAQEEAIVNGVTTNNAVTNGAGNNRCAPMQNVRSDRSRAAAALLCFFLGELGIHRFYAGRVGTGLLWLFTFGFCGIGTLIDFIVILCGGFKDGDGKKI